MENIKKFGLPAVVAVNRFPTDTEAEIKLLQSLVEKETSKAVLCEVWAKGAEGGEALAKEVVQMVENKESSFVPLYSVDESIENKICCIAKEIYRADDVNFFQKGIESNQRDC